MRVVIVCHAPDCPDRLKAQKPMKPTVEKPAHVVFECPTCLNVRTVHKRICGGTITHEPDKPVPRFVGKGADFA